MNKVSEIFENAFSTNSGCQEKCECGSVFFDGYNLYDSEWEEQKEGLRELVKRFPYRYFEVDHAIGKYCVLGKYYVYDCPCGGPVDLELFLLQHDSQIIAYMKERVKLLEKKIEEIKYDPTRSS